MTTTELIPVADGVRIRAERAGDGPPLVLLHGAVHDSRMWEHPERVRSLTLIASSVGGYEWPRSAEAEAYAAARRGSVGSRIAELELALWASLGDRAPGFEVIEPMVRENAEAGAAAEKGHALDPAEAAVGQPAGPDRGADGGRRRRSRPPRDRRHRRPSRRRHPRRTAGGGRGRRSLPAAAGSRATPRTPLPYRSL
ncbi:alpha/beta fold hydrolase [Streptomyces sp. G1]|uniref:alpha/beta fold hydrolase n=1 Tax=Streptomyces sp. G1 TaxID=361572 RepID=UPI00202F67CD|nr:hypothetical protein [Streptomyces sp. G1]MCM1965191.1 hypothetical protein [Streptomyces sp. G1]